jgi:hypothetical protein
VELRASSKSKGKEKRKTVHHVGSVSEDIWAEVRFVSSTNFSSKRPLVGMNEQTISIPSERMRAIYLCRPSKNEPEIIKFDVCMKWFQFGDKLWHSLDVLRDNKTSILIVNRSKSVLNPNC